jgi:hypothetical protein
MWQIGADQKYITRLEGTDIITGYNFPFTAEDQGKLYFRMLMKVIVKMMLTIFLQPE